MLDHSSDKIRGMLLSAGLGTRFRPITDKIPKPAIPFLNVPLMGYMLYELEKIGITSVVFNAHHLPDTIESCAECLTHGQTYQVNFSYEKNILGSGGGIRAADRFLGAGHTENSKENFVVANADEVILFNHDHGLKPLLDYHCSNQALVTLLTTAHPEAGKKLGGVWLRGDTTAAPNKNCGQIVKLGGQGQEPNPLHFTGVYIFSNRIFNYMPKSGEFHIFKDAIHKAMAAREKVLSFYDPELQWFDMSSQQDYLNCTRQALRCLAIDGSIKSKNLMAVLNRFGQKLERVAERQWMAPNAKFNGKLVEGSYLLMGENSTLKATTEVKDFAVIGSNSSFGPGFIQASVVAPNLNAGGIQSLQNGLLIGSSP